MKKSQILAALALAFALGVVAPVANTVVSADTYAVEYDPTRAASFCDVQNAIAAVNGYSYYNRYVKIYDLLEDWFDADLNVYYSAATGIDYKLSKIYSQGTGYIASSFKNKLSAAINGVRGHNGNTQPSVTNSAKATIDVLEGLMKDAEGTHYSNVDHGDFASFKKLFLIMVKENKDINVGDFRAAVEGIAGDNEASIDNDWNASQIRDYVLGSINGVDGQKWAHVDEYEAFAPIIAEYLNVDTYIGFTKSLNKALLDAPELTKGVKDTINDAYEGKRTGQPDLATALVEIATYNTNNANAGIKGFNYTDRATTYGYAQLISAANDAEEKSDKKDGGTSWNNRKLIDAIGNAFDHAVAIVPGTTKTTFKSLMASYNGTCGKDNKPNDGTGEGTNKPDDDKKDPNAPDTGILADGEANASTTVAMVAGIATALTAAGAGVVAYRNARRSTRK